MFLFLPYSIGFSCIRSSGPLRVLLVLLSFHLSIPPFRYVSLASKIDRFLLHPVVGPSTSPFSSFVISFIHSAFLLCFFCCHNRSVSLEKSIRSLGPLRVLLVLLSFHLSIPPFRYVSFVAKIDRFLLHPVVWPSTSPSSSFVISFIHSAFSLCFSCVQNRSVSLASGRWALFESF